MLGNEGRQRGGGPNVRSRCVRAVDSHHGRSVRHLMSLERRAAPNGFIAGRPDPAGQETLWLADRTVIKEVVLAQSERAGNFGGAMGGRSPRADDRGSRSAGGFRGRSGRPLTDHTAHNRRSRSICWGAIQRACFDIRHSSCVGSTRQDGSHGGRRSAILGAVTTPCRGGV
jgi:hypothetical protein